MTMSGHGQEGYITFDELVFIPVYGIQRYYSETISGRGSSDKK